MTASRGPSPTHETASGKGTAQRFTGPATTRPLSSSRCDRGSRRGSGALRLVRSVRAVRSIGRGQTTARSAGLRRSIIGSEYIPMSVVQVLRRTPSTQRIQFDGAFRSSWILDSMAAASSGEYVPPGWMWRMIPRWSRRKVTEVKLRSCPSSHQRRRVRQSESIATGNRNPNLAARSATCWRVRGLRDL